MSVVRNVPLYPIFDNSGPTTFTLSGGTDFATSHKLASTLRLETGRQINKLGIYCTAITSPPVLQLRVETPATLGGAPTLTLADTNTFGTFTPSIGYNVITLNNPYTIPSVAGNQSITLVCGLSSGTFGSVTFHAREPQNPRLTSWVSTYNGTSWTNNTGTNGLIWPIDQNNKEMIDSYHVFSYLGSTSQLFNSSSSPNEHGFQITAPYSFMCNGVRSFNRAPTSSNSITRLYVNNSQISTDSEWTINPGQAPGTTSNNPMDLLLTTPVYVKKGDNIIISILTSTTTNTYFYYQQLTTSGWATLLKNELVIDRVQRTGAGSWTSASQPTHFPLFAPLLDMAWTLRHFRNPSMGGGFIE